MAENQIKWTARAIKDLQKVYFFNIDLMGEEKSFALIERLLGRVERLADKRFVKMGPFDEQFSHYRRNYKKLFEGHLKITYRLSSDQTCVYINRVFDTRQNPT
jgi:plasmid stabilization system protein ParE